MTTEKFARLRKLCAEATPGPWEAEECEGDLSVRAGTARTQWRTTEDGFLFGRSPSTWIAADLIYQHELETWGEGEDAAEDQRRRDAEFIAAAREAIPMLLKALDEAEQ